MKYIAVIEIENEDTTPNVIALHDEMSWDNKEIYLSGATMKILAVCQHDSNLSSLITKYFNEIEK